MRLIDADALSDWMKDYGQKCINGERKISLMYVWKHIQDMQTIEPERTKYIQDTKAVPSDRDCVDLSEKVTATFYDDEPEEWLQMTVTIRDVLDSVCDSYTVIKPERKTGKWITKSTNGEIFDCCSICGYVEWDEPKNFCPNCGSYNGGIS